MITAVPQPATLLALLSHLHDDHHQENAFVASLGAAEAFDYHRRCHETGMPDHCHTDAVP